MGAKAVGAQRTVPQPSCFHGAAACRLCAAGAAKSTALPRPVPTAAPCSARSHRCRRSSRGQCWRGRRRPLLCRSACRPPAHARNRRWHWMPALLPMQWRVRCPTPGRPKSVPKRQPAARCSAAAGRRDKCNSTGNAAQCNAPRRTMSPSCRAVIQRRPRMPHISWARPRIVRTRRPSRSVCSCGERRAQTGRARLQHACTAVAAAASAASVWAGGSWAGSQALPPTPPMHIHPSLRRASARRKAE